MFRSITTLRPILTPPILLAQPAFHARRDTPRVNNLLTGGLLDENPNSAQPFRLDLTQAVTCDQDHDYADEQKAHNHGLMDKFPESVGTGGPGCPDYGHGPGLVMGYYDGNTVTAMWNYAQYFRHERQLIRNHLRTVDSRSFESGCRKYCRRNPHRRKR